MRGKGRSWRLIIAAASVSFVLWGCAPLPPLQPAETGSRSTFAPQVSSPSEGVSPLQPTLPPAATATPPPPAATATDVPTLSPTATPASTLHGRIWEWTESSFKDGSGLRPNDPSRYTLELLPDGNALAQADCNFGTGSYREASPALAFGAIGATKVACPPDSLDSAFLAQLSKVERYAFEGEELVLFLQDKAGQMRLVAQPAPATPTPLPSPTPQSSPTPLPSPTATRVVPSPTPLPAAEPGLGATAWTLETLYAGGRPQPLAPGSATTLVINEDVTGVTGSTGCNDYRIVVGISGDQISFAAPALTSRKMCAAASMLQEVGFIDSLLRARAYVMSDGRLVLTQADGAPLLSFVRNP